MAKKLSAGKDMDSLLSKLLAVPKQEADAAAKRWKRERKKQRKKNWSHVTGITKDNHEKRGLNTESDK